MKKTIAAILVAVIAGLASPTVFSHSISHTPTTLEIKAAQKESSFFDKIVDFFRGLF